MKKTTKLVFMSIVTIALCISLIAGATFALFTSESSVNIAVTSGKVDVDAKIDESSLVLYSIDEATQEVKALGEGATTFVTGGTATFNDENADLALEKMVPGDGVDFDITITNNSNVAVIWQVKITSDGGTLFDALVMSTDGIEMADSESSKISAWESFSAAETGKEVTLTISIRMPFEETRQDLTKTIITVTVNALQGNAQTQDPIVYPAGITYESFADNQVAVTSDGKFIENTSQGMKDAINAGGELYFKEGATVAAYAAHPNVTNDLTIYANGADFGGKDISIGTYAAPTNTETTINIYNAKNLFVWGQPIVGRYDIWNVNLYNCENDGYGLLTYRGGGAANATINFTAVNCTATGYNDSFIHTTADGTMKITNCTFIGNCAPVNIAHKQSGEMNIIVENCTFEQCGKIKPEDDYFAPARFVNNSSIGTMNVTLKNNTFIETIGTNGDILLGDYRDGKASNMLTTEIITSSTVMVKSSVEEAYSYDGGTIVIGNN